MSTATDRKTYLKAWLEPREPTDMVLVYWYNCECVYLTRYCNENHRRSALVPRSVLTNA